MAYVEILEIAFPAETEAPGVLSDWKETAWGKASEGTLSLDGQVVARVFSDRTLFGVRGSICEQSAGWTIATIKNCVEDLTKAAVNVELIASRFPRWIVVCLKDPDDVVNATLGGAVGLAQLVERTGSGEIPGFAIHNF